MKNPLLILITLVVSFSGVNAQFTEKETVSAFLETKKGVRHDLKLKFEEFDLYTVTVADSIQILKEKYEVKKLKKLTSLDKQIASYQKRINQKKDTPGAADKVVEASLQKRYKYDRDKLIKRRQEAENWKPNYLNRYANSADKSKALIKKVNAIFFAQKPWEKLPAKYRGTFIVSLDGKKCYKMIPYPKTE